MQLNLKLEKKMKLVTINLIINYYFQKDYQIMWEQTILKKILMKKIKISSKVKIIRGNLFQKNNSSKVRAGNLIKGKIDLKKNAGKNLFAKLSK